MPATGRSKLTDATSCLVVGASVGWLVGLSMSPVLGTVLVPILALVSSVVAIASGVGHSDPSTASNNKTFSPAPLALLTLSLAVAATGGAWIRANGFLGPSAKVAGPEQQTGPFSAEQQSTASFVPQVGLMNARLESDCAVLQQVIGSGTREAGTVAQRMLVAKHPVIQALATVQVSETDLINFVEWLCREPRRVP